METKKKWVTPLIIVAFVLLIGFIILTYLKKEPGQQITPPPPPIEMADTTSQQITPPPPATNDNPCQDVLSLKTELEKAQEKLQAAEKKVNIVKIDLQAAQKKCAEITGVNESTKTSSPTSTKAKQQRSTTISTPAEPQQVSSRITSAPANNVSTSVTEAGLGKALFCVNIRDMDDSSYWPQLAIEAGDVIEGAVLNQSGDGHNISIGLVTTPTGLYGATTDGRIFVKASLIDKYGPTIIKMAGGPKGWNTWRTARLVGEYYIAE